MELKYVEENGECILTDRNGFQVMMEWEKPYMEALIDRLNPTGKVLEIGFGMGYSANQIQKYNIESHTIVENDKEVIKKLKVWAAKQPHEVIILEGLWQEILYNYNGKFDSVFCDDSPCDGPTELNDPSWRQNLMLEYMLFNLANVGCRLSWYADRPPWLKIHPATEFSSRDFEVNITKNCNYISERTKRFSRMYMPVITYPYGTLNDYQREQFREIFN
jgi:hypothetical protein